MCFACRCSVEGVSAVASPTGGGPSEADRALRDAVASRGWDVSYAQIGRYRDEHLIPTPNQISGLHGPGVWSVDYPDGTVERVLDILEVFDLPGKRMTYDEVPIWLFLLHRPVNIEDVRQAWRRTHAKVMKKRPVDEDGIDQIERNIRSNATRNLLGRFLKFRTGTHLILASNLPGRILSSLTSRMMGEIPNKKAERKLAGLIGLGDKEGRAFFSGLLDQAVLDNVAGQIAALTDEQLVRARDNWTHGLELLIRCIPGVTYVDHLDAIKKYRQAMPFDGWSTMINLMFLAYAEETLDYFSSRLVEVLNDVRGSHSDDLPAKP